MGRVRYARNPRELERLEEGRRASQETEFRLLRAVYESDAEVVQAVVPRPLEPLVQPEIDVWFLATGGLDAEGIRREVRTACVGVRVEYDGVPGCYPITMPTSSERAVLAGRERRGEPRKLAEVALEVDEAGGRVAGRATRGGIRFVAVTGERHTQEPPAEVSDFLYCFKAFPACETAAAFETDPRLVRVERVRRCERRWVLRGGVELAESPLDPVADLPVRRLVSLQYDEGRLSIAARGLRPVPGEWLWPFLHQRYDAPEVEGVEV